MSGTLGRFGYGAAAAIVAAATAVAWSVFGRDYPADVVMLYLLGVVVASLSLGRGPALAAAVLSVAAFDYVFIPPYFTFSVDDPRHIVTFAVMLVVALVTDHLTRRVRDEAEAARESERRTVALHEMTRDLAGGVERAGLVSTAAGHVARVFDADVVVLVPDGEDLVVAHRTTGPPEVSPDERGVARWVWTEGREAGLASATFPAAHGLFLPLVTSHGALGVLGVVPREPVRLAEPEDRRFLAAFAAQMSVALERARLAEESAGARVEAERERLRNALLSSVSHDLRTPLGVIEGAASTLLSPPAALDAEARRDLLETIHEEAESLNRRVRNLLDMTRLESGAVELDVEWQSVEEVVGAALERVERRHGGRVRVDLPSDLPLVPCDGALLEIVLVNLLENALKFAPEPTPVEVSARARRDEIVVSVADQGPGVRAGDEEAIFAKFSRGTRPAAGGGVGLGLAICRAVVSAHGGRIWAEAREGGGAVFRLALPRRETPPSRLPEEVPA